MIAINGKSYDVKYFPEGELNMLDTFIQDPQFDRSVVILRWQFENIAEQVVLYNLVNYIKDILGSAIILELPYVPNARMDRTKRPLYEVHTLKYFCKFINDLNFERVIVEDVHSPVTMTLLERAVELNIKDRVYKLVEELQPDYLFFPDKGALDRYGYLICRTPFYGEKKRDWRTGDILGYEILNPYNIAESDYVGKSILIIDDISSYGGTFHHAANKLAEYGFGDTYLYVTHCEHSIMHGDLIKNPLMKHIYTTNSIYFGAHDKITVIN